MALIRAIHLAFLVVAASASLAPDANAQSGRRWYLSPVIGMYSWQENYTLTYTDSTTYKAIAVPTALCLGSSALYRINRTTELDFSGCMLAGSTRGLLSSDSTNAPVLYEANAVPVIGAKLSVGYFYRPESGSATFGISVPLVIRSIDWPTVNAVYTEELAGAIAVGAMLDARFFAGRWTFSPKVGFLRDVTSLAWAIETGYFF